MKGSHNNINYLVNVSKREDLGGYSASFSFSFSKPDLEVEDTTKAYELMNSDKSLSIFKSQEDAESAAENCVRNCIDDGFVKYE
ncbi:hypothetical protein [Enterovibrio nigricans]|uniref:Uncharacterized protein n=1 Tax=Enterovibrio nigricans DSM 22720 TaxID=1121868 RepID=A0A1T4VPQ1_9GAMM|nr:hypothetical protein [Enterovibrio nigricans]PKF49129.1 hypothetical protein AT251_21160 [Enterovibrio nigricans]SKA66940.1 hypothetical protein SAMN02745132_04160 [Enterovibrio nigricans DSM 22720]